jgi:hypothetical protein
MGMYYYKMLSKWRDKYAVSIKNAAVSVCRDLLSATR